MYEEWTRIAFLNRLCAFSFFSFFSLVSQLENLLEEPLVDTYRRFYDKFLTGEIDSSRHRHDLGSHADQKQTSVENITQIMWPSDYIEGLQQVRSRLGFIISPSPCLLHSLSSSFYPSLLPVLVFPPSCSVSLSGCDDVI